MAKTTKAPTRNDLLALIGYTRARAEVLDYREVFERISCLHESESDQLRGLLRFNTLSTAMDRLCLFSWLVEPGGH